MEHCRGSLVREGGSLESYWCPAPQEFKSLPRRSSCSVFFFIRNEIWVHGTGDNGSSYDSFRIFVNRIPINGNEMFSPYAVLMEKSIGHVIDVIITYRLGMVMLPRTGAPDIIPFCMGVPFRQFLTTSKMIAAANATTNG
jgi:hypothetical protein